MIFHKEIGHGPVKVAVIHGWFGDHRAFETMFDYLDVKRFTYAFVDIRGYGNSRNEIGDYTMAEIAADTTNIFNHTQYNGSYVGGLGNTNLTNNPSAGLIPGFGTSSTFGTLPVNTFDPRQVTMRLRVVF